MRGRPIRCSAASSTTSAWSLGRSTARRSRRGPLRNERNGQLIVERIADLVPLGTVGWHKVGYGPGTASEAWNIGIELAARRARPGLRRRGPGAARAFLFAQTPTNRVEAQTDVENIAEQRSLEKAGFRREGVARGSQFRAGGYHDLVVYSRLRDDP